MSEEAAYKDQNVSSLIRASSRNSGKKGVTLVMMPFLGGSWREWEAVTTLRASLGS
jgi:hypothetical protein